MTRITRRVFVGVGAAATLATPYVLRQAKAQAPAAPAPPAGPLKQPPLGFHESQLAPTIGARTVMLHYGRHHAAYYANLNNFTKIYNLVEHEYADKVDPNKAIYGPDSVGSVVGAIPGMLRTLDPHSNFFDPAAFARIREEQ